MAELYPENALILAPLSGFTDLAYRRAAYRCGCRFAFTEMVDAASLAYANGNGETLLKRGEDEEFLAVQIVGAEEELLKKGCEKLNAHDFTLLDFNLGCPVPKVVKKHAGAALGADPERALKCFEVLAKYSRFPLTAKLRILSDADPEPTVKLCRKLVERGAQALTVHGRTKEHFYSGPVNFEVISAVREACPEAAVIANGGVRCRATYDEMRQKSGCSRVMLAQGAMGNPWLFGELAGLSDGTPTLDEWRGVVLEHIDGMIALYGEASAMKQARKILHDYLRGRHFPSEFRAEASLLSSRAELLSLLERAKPLPPPPGATRRIAG